MQVCLLRVGIDTGSGGMLGPLLRDGSFEYVPIPEDLSEHGRKYGEIHGKKDNRLLSEFFSTKRQARIRDTLAHLDPEFDSYTYGDPTRPKRSLRELEQGDLLVFYAGLEPHGFEDSTKRGLYVIGYFEVEAAGEAVRFAKDRLSELFGKNQHVKYPRKNEAELVLVKGSTKSRLLRHAHLISKNGRDRSGNRIYVLSDDAKSHFGTFTKLNAIQRSIPRWVSSDMAEKAAEWVRQLD